MSKTLDFLVGGMPRGGTTAAGQLFNVHPDSYCYAAETHLLPICMEFAAGEPVPRASLKQVEQILLEQNRQVLFEMPHFSVGRGASKRALIFEETDIKPLTDKIMAPIANGEFGAELSASVLPILRKHIAEKVGRPVLGEKTPNNVDAFDRYGPMGTRALFMLIREPFAVIRSMQNRGKDESDIYAGPFRSALSGLIGIYVSYMEAILSATRHPEAHVLVYETMMERPVELIHDIYRSVGLESSEAVLSEAAKLFKERHSSPPWDGMSPRDRGLVMGLTSKIRAAAGYDDEFYRRHGYPSETMHTLQSDEIEERIEPLWGANPRAEGDGAQWLMDKGCLALTTAPGRRKATIRLWANYPQSVLASSECHTFTLTDYADRQKILECIPIQAGSNTADVTLDLSEVEPVVAGSGGEVRLLSFQATRAFRSYLTTVSIDPRTVRDFIDPRRLLRSSGKGILGTDRRLMSFAVVGFKVA